LKERKSSNIWEQTLKIKFLFIKKLRENYIQEVFCYHSVQNFCLPVCYLKNIKIKVYRTIMLPVVLSGYTTRWEDNIKLDLQELGCGGEDWIELAQDRDTCECGNEPAGLIKCGEFLDWLTTTKFLKKEAAP
jgi:hypothetical protein